MTTTDTRVAEPAAGFRRFVAGPDPADAARVVHDLHAAGIACTVGRFAPVADDEATARTTAGHYTELAGTLGRLPAGTRLEIDLPHVGLDVSPGLAVELVEGIGRHLPDGALLQFGAEDAGRTDAVLDVAVAAHRRGVPVRATVQANLRRSTVDVEWLVAEEVPIRLVKGGFPEPADIALTTREEIDAAIRRLAGRITAAGVDLSLATHDVVLQEWARALRPEPQTEMLFGVLPEVAARLATDRRVRLYVPFGTGGDEYVAKRISDERAATGGSPS